MKTLAYPTQVWGSVSDSLSLFLLSEVFLVDSDRRNWELYFSVAKLKTSSCMWFHQGETPLDIAINQNNGDLVKKLREMQVAAQAIKQSIMGRYTTNKVIGWSSL